MWDRRYLQENFAAVDAHGIHGAESHESDGDRRCCVHCVIVTEHTHAQLTQAIQETQGIYNNIIRN